MSEHELWNELGNLYFLTGTYNQAAYAYNRSIRLDASFGRPYCNLALTYVKQGRFEEAVQLYQRSIELLVDDKEKAITWYRLGDVYRHLKDYRDAILAYQQADLLDASMSQDQKESDQILYGGSAIEIPLHAPVVVPVPEPEPAVEALPEPPAAQPEPMQEAEQVLEPVAEAVPVEPQMTVEIQEPVEQAPVEVEALEPVSLVEDMAEPVLETEPVAEAELVEEPVLETEPIAEPVLEGEPAPLAEAELLEEPVLATEPEPIVDAVASASITETSPVDEMPAAEPLVETTTIQEGLPPVTETISEMGMADPGLIDDEELYSTFDHETEFYIPDYTDEQLDQWLPLPEPEPEPEPELARIFENHLQLAAEPTVVRTERWQPVYENPVPLQEMPSPVEPEPELHIEDSELSDTFIIPDEQSVEPEAELEEQAAAEEPDEARVLEGDTIPLTTMHAPQAADEIEDLEEIETEISKFKGVVQKNPRNASAWDTLGTLYKSARRYRDAILAYQQAVAADPTKAPYHHHLGIIYAIEGREEDAMKAFQEVLERDPNHSLAHATLGGYYHKMGYEELAQKHIGKAMKNFYNSENEYNRACLEALCGNIEQSIELLRIALKNKQTYVDWVLRDPDLDSIRRDPRFKQLISDYTV